MQHGDDVMNEKKKQLTVIVRISPEQLPVDIRVHGCVPRPHVPHPVAHRILDEPELLVFPAIVQAVAWRLRVGVVLRVKVLRR